MKYLLLIYQKEVELTAEARDECYEESGRLLRELDVKGWLVAAAPLHPTTTATSVRVRDGRRSLTDGPYAETHEQLGGYFLVDVPDLDAALEIAARIPGARKGAVEVRPLIDLSHLEATSLLDASATA